MNELNITYPNSLFVPSKIKIEELMKIEGFSWKIQLALLDMLCRFIKPNCVVEFGTWHGRSAVIFSSYVNDTKGMFWGIEPDKERQEITQKNCELVCPDGKIYIEKNISYYSSMKGERPFTDIVHIDGEHSFNAVYGDLDLAKKILIRNGIIILDDFFFDMYPQITQATYKWLENNPDYILVAVGFCKGMICNRMFYNRYADMFLNDEFLTEIRKYDTGVSKISITRTSPLSDCLTLGLSTYVSTDNYVGNECADGKMEHISKL